MGMADEMHREGWSPLAAVEAESPADFRELREELERQQASLKRKLDKGVAPDIFKRGQALIGAYDAALRGLDKARHKRFGDG